MLDGIRTFFKSIMSLVTAVMMILTLGSSGVSNTPTPSEKDYDQVKNVIYFIGDGMGPLHLEKTKQERNVALSMDTFPYKGRSITRSLSHKVTDSAAGGTALSCGVRTYNGAVGVYISDPVRIESVPRSITELCREKGMATGVVTTDKTSGATPATFTVHSTARGLTMDIDYQQIASPFDLIWGGVSEYTSEKNIERAGFTYVDTYDEMMNVKSGERSFAQFKNDLWHVTQSDPETPNLEQMTMKAIDVLDDTDEGFFLMVEGAHIDKNSHGNKDAEMTEALEEFDRTISEALKYAKSDGETLIVVTADHETGKIVLNDDGSYSFTQASHSDTNVPVLVYGSDTFIENDEVLNNFEIPIRIAYSLGFDETQFPKTVEKF